MATEEKPSSSEESQNRGLQVNLPTSYATHVDRWAIVVGISQYKDKSLNLKYADRDAEALYELLLTPSGGGFEKEHVVKLVNEKATTANITKALRSFLKKPAKEDIVLIYFACHGAPDIDRPGIVYLLTHDVDPKDISGTALPMREIDLSLRENLLAERVIILADTCHSAAIGGGIGRRAASDSSAIVNSYLREVGKSRGGVALLTSAEANEVSFEDAKWGDGHGVFTHYLLEGMKGAADRSPKNGVVTVGELFEYVRENVQQATDNKQHPCVGTNSFDRNLPVAITAGISAQEHYEVGCQLYQIGLKLDDKYCFESASRHLQEAIRQAAVIGSKLPETYLQLGLALNASGDLQEEAIAAFKKAIKAGLTDADYYLGITYLNQGKTEEAKQHLETFLSKVPDSDRAIMVQDLISWIDATNFSRAESVNRYGLLIGINYSELKDPLFPPLKGCVNDIEILNEVLTEKHKFKIKMLADIEATYENIINAFHELQNISTSRDIVIIYYGGHVDADSWVAVDTKLDEQGNRLNTINASEIYDLIDAIPSFHKHLIMDTCVNSKLSNSNKRMEQSKICSLLYSSSPGEFAYEELIEKTQTTHGYFTYILVQELWKNSAEVIQKDLLEQIKVTVQLKYPKQTLYFTGNIDKPFFFPSTESLTYVLNLVQCCRYSALSHISLRSLQQKIISSFAVFPDFHYSLGLAYLEKECYEDALHSLIKAVHQSKQKRNEKIFDLGISQFKNQLYDDAIQTFQECLNSDTSEVDSTLYGNVISSIHNLTKAKRCALLIGIESYLESPAISNTASNTIALQNILIDKYGFQTEDVKVLLNENATYENIQQEFKKLVSMSCENSGFLYFTGRGSVDKQDNPTILAFDSRSHGIPDILLADLAQFVSSSEFNLVSILDSCWSMGGDRFVECNENSFSTHTRKLIVSHDSNAIERNDSLIPEIGNLSIYSQSIKYIKSDTLLENLTPLLIQFLKDENSTMFTYQKLWQAYKKVNKNYDAPYYYGVYFTNSRITSRSQIFSATLLELKVRDSLKKVKEEPIQQAIIILKRLVEQRNGNAPDELLNLGIAFYMLRNYDKSIASLQSAIEQVVSSNESSKPYPEAYYWLGRVLYESKKDPTWAVSELRLATQQNPDNIAAHYYLGKSLQSLVEQEILSEAERAYQTYIDAGSPLGQVEEVQEFLLNRKKQQNG